MKEYHTDQRTGKGHIAILGGDKRTRYLAERLAGKGWEVRRFGMDIVPQDPVSSEKTGCPDVAGKEMAPSSLSEVIADARAVILPQPAFVQEKKLFCPFYKGTPPTAEEIFACVPANVSVYGGRFSPAMLEYANQRGIRLVDYMKMETVQLRNALPTAEGALYLAMQQMERTLDTARVAVLGYGRIGSLLAQKLQLLGAKVTVAVRKARDAAHLENQHMEVLMMRFETGGNSLCRLREGYDVIFNTVPYRILTQEVLEGMPAGTLLIELASAPGGWDPSDRIPCRTCYAPGLPGQYAPRTAGEILADCLEPLILEGGEG